jgi:predicted enzyme related to lactoylglutathione lyase
MEVLASRAVLRPADFNRAFEFYAHQLGLHIFREWGDGDERGVVFFLGIGFLEVSGHCRERAGEKVQLWLQVRELDAVHRDLAAAGVPIDEAPDDKPWGLREMRIHDPDGVVIIVIQVPDDHPLRRRPAG